MGSVLDQLFERAERELRDPQREKVAAASAEMAAGIDRLARVLASDTATGGVNAQAMALRLWMRGVRVTR